MDPEVWGGMVTPPFIWQYTHNEFTSTPELCMGCELSKLTSRSVQALAVPTLIQHCCHTSSLFLSFSKGGRMGRLNRSGSHLLGSQMCKSSSSGHNLHWIVSELRHMQMQRHMWSSNTGCTGMLMSWERSLSTKRVWPHPFTSILNVCIYNSTLRLGQGYQK